MAQRRSRSPSPRRKEPESSRTKRTRGAESEHSHYHWADRTDTIHDLQEITDEDFDEGGLDNYEEAPEKSELSEETKTLLQQAMTIPLNNNTREIRNRYPVPESDATCTPKLDEIFTSSESKFQRNLEGKAIEKDLLQITAYMLDAVGPLLSLIEGVKEGEFSPSGAKDLAVNALSLLGNSIAHSSQIRKKRY